jgi:hypothetical protein
LKELKALTKTHYSWCLPDNVLAQPDERHFEYVRITGAACLQGEYATAEQVATCVKLCHRANDKLTSIGINLKPYHNLPQDTDHSWLVELVLLKTALLNCKICLGLENSAQGATVAVSAILLDSEQFYVSDDPVWNARITVKYDEVYDLCKSVFPDARVEWYGRGIQAGEHKTGWGPQPWNTFDNKADSFSCDLYRVAEFSEMCETFRRTHAFAKTKVMNPVVTPWIALGSGYRRQVDQYQKWDMVWDYDLIYSWILGMVINVPWFGWPEQEERFAPWNAAKVAVFYPPPFDPRVPSWCKHFVAYCRGAEERKELP